MNDLYHALFLATVEAVQKGYVPASAHLETQIRSFANWCAKDPNAALAALIADTHPSQHKVMLSIARRRPEAFGHLIGKQNSEEKAPPELWGIRGGAMDLGPIARESTSAFRRPEDINLSAKKKPSRRIEDVIKAAKKQRGATEATKKQGGAMKAANKQGGSMKATKKQGGAMKAANKQGGSMKAAKKAAKKP